MHLPRMQIFLVCTYLKIGAHAFSSRPTTKNSIPLRRVPGVPGVPTAVAPPWRNGALGMQMPASHEIESDRELERELETSSMASWGISEAQADNLHLLLSEALFRVSFFLQTDYLYQVDSPALQELVQVCQESVEVRPSTIPNAGDGLFATQDIPKHTIVALYPVHCLGCQFPSGLFQSVQVEPTKDSNANTNGSKRIDHETSQYILSSLGNRPLCGVDLEKNFGGAKVFVDLNPHLDVGDAWQAGKINDGATVQGPRDSSYYPRSRQAQNTELLPFSAAPFHVAMTTRDIAQGEELLVCYGYKYWAATTTNTTTHQTTRIDGEEEVSYEDRRFEELRRQQEGQVAAEIESSLEVLHAVYAEAAWVLGQIFDQEMNGEEPPSLIAPIYPRTTSRILPGGLLRKRWLGFLRRILSRRRP